MSLDGLSPQLDEVVARVVSDGNSMIAMAVPRGYAIHQGEPWPVSQATHECEASTSPSYVNRSLVVAQEERRPIADSKAPAALAYVLVLGHLVFGNTPSYNIMIF